MNSLRFHILRLCVAGLLATMGQPVPAVEWPPLAEVADRLRAFLPDLPEPSSPASDVGSYLRQLSPRVIPAPAPSPGATSVPPLTLTVLDAGGPVAYLRPSEIRTNLRADLDAALAGLRSSNQLKGLVLDLRRSHGTDVAAAVQAAGAFVGRPVRDIRSGSREFTAEPSPTPIAAPLMVLVGSGTTGASEVLAAVLRRLASPSLLIGTNTAGHRWEYREVHLAPGAVVHVAGAPVLLPGEKPLPEGGLVPDLRVALDPRDEEAYLLDPYALRSNGAPAQAGSRLRLNEAELVRRRFGPNGHPSVSGFDEESGAGRRPTRLRSDPLPSPLPPAIQDPVLARALDLVSGLAETSSGTGDSR